MRMLHTIFINYILLNRLLVHIRVYVYIYKDTVTFIPIFYVKIRKNRGTKPVRLISKAIFDLAGLTAHSFTRFLYGILYSKLVQFFLILCLRFVTQFY